MYFYLTFVVLNLSNNKMVCVQRFSIILKSEKNAGRGSPGSSAAELSQLPCVKLFSAAHPTGLPPRLCNNISNSPIQNAMFWRQILKLYMALKEKVVF
jgi:hypothetical protein